MTNCPVIAIIIIIIIARCIRVSYHNKWSQGHFRLAAWLSG